MIRSFSVWLLMLGLCLSGWLSAATFQLADGGTLTGEPISFTAQGVVVKTPEGAFAERVAWTNFTEASLRQLVKFPQAKRYIEPLLDLDEPEPAARKPRPTLKFTPPPRLDRPDPRAGVGALFASPLTLTLFLVLYLANIYAGYEVSLFRNYPRLLVCGAAAVAPVIGPVIFLCLPTRIPGAEAAAETLVEGEDYAAVETGPEGEAAPEAEQPPPLPAEAKAALPPATIYQRGTTTFNRRFFETKLAGFMRTVPSEEDKDMVIQIRSARGDHVGTRLARVMPNELYLHVVKAGASTDVCIPYNEIYEIKIRHKDAG